MRKIALLTVIAGMLLTAGVASAQDKDSGLQLGLRTGYMIPMGDSMKDAKLSDGVKSGIPIWIDVGYRLDPSLYLGVYGNYGIMQRKDDCPSGADCSLSQLRFGVNAHYHIMPAEQFDPWVGFGVGYEILNSKVSAGGVDAKADVKGFEFANIQVGGDYKVMPDFAIGPFVSFSVGQYSKTTVTVNGSDESKDIDDKAMHEWLTIGIRGAYNL